MPSTKWIYPICVFFAILLYLLTQNHEYPHPDSSYLNARYARHLVEGKGFVFNPDEKILLTWSPLIVLAHAAVSLPAGEVNSPPVLLWLVMMGIGAAALARNFAHTGLSLEWGIGAALAWAVFLAADVSFGGVAGWLAAFSLVAVDLAWSQKWRLAGIMAGLMILISPVALIFVILLGIQAVREKAVYWRWTVWPALVWYGFAAWYFDDLHGLTLAPLAESQISSEVILVFGAVVLFWAYRSLKRSPPLLILIIVWGVGYSLFSAEMALLTLTLVIVILFTLQHETKILKMASGLTAVVLLALLITQAEPHGSVADTETVGSSVGYWGSDKEAFHIKGVAYQMEGRRNPQLYVLDTFEDVLLATAPDFLLPSDENVVLPTSAPVQLLNYSNEDGIWRRGTDCFPWQEAQEVNLDFGPDLRLKNIGSDRGHIAPGGVLRLRLDWELKNQYTPVYDVLMIFQVLDDGEAVLSGIEQTFPPERWENLQTTTYHVVPVSEDAPPGLYDILLIVGYNGGTLARHVLVTVKIPAPTDREFTAPPLANFNDLAELMQATITQEGENLLVNLVWRAQDTFTADYTVFVHLTPADDVQPVAQGDAPPEYGTLLWEKGEIIEDAHTIPLANVPPGQYVVRVGFFHPEQGRIPLVDGRDAFVVGEFEK